MVNVLTAVLLALVLAGALGMAIDIWLQPTDEA